MCNRCQSKKHCPTCPVNLSNPIDVSNLPEPVRAAFNRTLVGTGYCNQYHDHVHRQSWGWKLGQPKPQGLATMELPQLSTDKPLPRHYNWLTGEPVAKGA
jgi:hypothetical protein